MIVSIAQLRTLAAYKTPSHRIVHLVLTDKVQSLTDSVEKERGSRVLAEQRAHDASLRVDVLSSYFNEKEKEFDRYLLLFTFALCYLCH